MFKLLNAILLLALCAASDVTRPFMPYEDAEGIFRTNPDPVDADGNCNGCNSGNSGSEACTDWNDVSIGWDNEGTSSFWNLFGAFSNNSICRDLGGRAEERIEEELRSCGVNRNTCDTISTGFDSSANEKDCDNVSCFLFFFFCSIDCTRISCIYDLNCDP